MKDKERYDQVCFTLDKKRTELENIRTDLFILNPDITKLIDEILELEKEKESLEDKINDRK